MSGPTDVSPRRGSAGTESPHGDCGPPALPVRVTRGVDRFFAGLSAMRGQRIFHPQAIAFRAVMAVETPVDGVPLLGHGAEHAAVVRFSRALGTPRGRVDLLGVAIRVGDVQDLLLASSSAAPLARYVPLPARGFRGTTFSSLLPFHAGSRVALVGARVEAPGAGADDQLDELDEAAGRGRLAVALALASAAGRWDRCARVEVGARLPDEEADELWFDPWRCAGGLVPWGRINAIRAPAYAGSRRGRGA